jgi:TPR repeat protein
MYCTGQGVPQDLPKAVTWYELAAKLGNPLAQYNLAVMATKGQGCAPDRDKALCFFKSAAEQGLPAAQIALREFDNPAGAIS